MTWRDGELHEETFTSYDAAKAAMEEHVGSGNVVHSPESDGRPQSLFQRLVKVLEMARKSLPRALRDLGLDAAAARAAGSVLKWMDGTNRAEFQQGIQDLLEKAGAPDGAVFSYFGRNLAAYLQDLKMSRETMVGFLHEIEKAAGKTFLPADLDKLSVQERTRAIDSAWAEMFVSYAKGEITEVPKALRTILQLSSDLAHLANDKFTPTRGLDEIPTRIKTPEERAHDSREKKDGPAKAKTEQILQQIRERIGDGTAERMDVEARERGEIPRMTREELLLLDCEHEIVLVYGMDGTLLDYKTDMERDRSVLPGHFLDQEVIFVHHHPSGGPPSTGDLRAICENADALFRILARQENGNVIVYEIQAHPDTEYPEWRAERDEIRMQPSKVNSVVRKYGSRSWARFSSKHLSLHKNEVTQRGFTRRSYLRALGLILQEMDNKLSFTKQTFASHE